MPRKKEFDQTAILDKAVALFWQKGFHATSAQDLVECLGISRSSLYDTYTDKKNLFKLSLQQYQETNTNPIVTLVAQSKNPESTLKQIYATIIRESDDDEATKKGCFMVNTAVELAGQDEEIGQLVHANNKSVEDALSRLVKKGQDEGLFNTAKSPRTYARFLFGAITAMRVTARSGADKKMLHDIMDVTLSALK